MAPQQRPIHLGSTVPPFTQTSFKTNTDYSQKSSILMPKAGKSLVSFISPDAIMEPKHLFMQLARDHIDKVVSVDSQSILKLISLK